jgi:hypothetical protein
MEKKLSWQKIRKNARAREKYHMKKYGNLDRMHAIDKKYNDDLQKEDSENEYKRKGIN